MCCVGGWPLHWYLNTGCLRCERYKVSKLCILQVSKAFLWPIHNCSIGLRKKKLVLLLLMWSFSEKAPALFYDSIPWCIISCQRRLWWSLFNSQREHFQPQLHNESSGDVDGIVVKQDNDGIVVNYWWL